MLLLKNYSKLLTDPTPQNFHVQIDIRNKWFKAGADLGGGGGVGRPLPPPPSGIRPPADPKGPPFDTFSEIHFRPTDPKIFVKAPLAPIYTNFEGERAPNKTRFFFVKIFQNVPKNGFFDCFFKNLPAAQKI